MPDVAELHEQRARADAFGAVAEEYDRYRPGYPEELMDRLAALHPAAVLDVGCGTGKASRQLLDRGLTVLGIEPDPFMAGVARRNGVEVETAMFERWDDHGRTFDLIVSGQAWHWVDNAVGAPRLVRLLRPSGTVCLFWNVDELADEEQAIVDDVYRRLAPELRDPPGRADDDTHAQRLRDSGCFRSVRAEHLAAQRTSTVDDWIARVSTYSRHLLLGPQRLARVQAELRAALSGRSQVHDVGGTIVVWAKP